MKNLKYKILFVILFMTIGIAAVTSNLTINGTTSISNNPDDFLVYFSNYVDFGDQSDTNYTDANVTIQSSNKITFTGTLDTVGEAIAIDVDIVNASKNYDANVTLSCNTNSEYIYLQYGIANNTISARGSVNAGFEARLIKSYTGEEELKAEITCTFTATPVERTTINNNTVVEPLSRTYFVGEEITIGTEKFNIISDNGSTITMLAQKSLDTNYVQSDTPVDIAIGETTGWEYTPGPQEIDLETWSNGFIYTMLNQYKEHLKTLTNSENIETDLITLNQLKNLGCTIPSDYYYTNDSTKRNCYDSPYQSWLINSQVWWTKSADSANYDGVWKVMNTGELYNDWYGYKYTVRPVITIFKSSIPTEIISFQIDDTTYQAEQGMTWEAWLNSKYNTNNYFYQEIDSKNKWVCTYSACGDHVNLSNNHELIKADYSYEISSNFPIN